MGTRLVELAKAGERDPNRLCEEALKVFADVSYGDVARWLRTDRRHIRASIDRLSKSADTVVQMQRRIQASVAADLPARMKKSFRRTQECAGFGAKQRITS